MMNCSECDHNIVEESKYCNHCGMPVVNEGIKCKNCGRRIPDEYLYCGYCGTLMKDEPEKSDSELEKLQKYIPSYLAQKIRQSEGKIEGERRNVTVVFADISGFTAMSERRDPEEVARIVTTCHTALGKVVAKYDGVVDKIVGDGIMSIFGVPVRENDPERAVLASLDMLATISELSQGFVNDIGLPIGLSIGINTGVVVIGDIGTDERLDYTVIGDVVNTASRMQHEAQRGEILVTKSTYERTAHCFDFQELEPIEVKGKSEPLTAYKVLKRKEKPLRERGIAGVETPLIGRNRELSICMDVVDKLDEGEGGVMLITGEAGFGKSRLASEIKHYAKDKCLCDDNGNQTSISRFTWIEGRCVSHSRSINYWVFTDALKNHFEIKNIDNSENIEEKIKTRYNILNAGRSDNGSAGFSIIKSLLSPRMEEEDLSEDLEEADRKLRIFSAIRDFLIMESQHKPMIVVLDDLHWADEISIELLNFLIKELSDEKIVFICIYRPPIPGEMDTLVVKALEDNIPDEINCTKVALNPLSQGDSSVLLGSILDSEELPQEMKELMLSKAAGNPFYLEEVIKSLADNGVIEQKNGKWIATKDIENVKVPGTVQDVIMARIDRLSEKPKHILQYASIIGYSFDKEILSHLYSIFDSRTKSEELQKHLSSLEDMGFISRDLNRGQSFIFRHVLIQDVAYNTVLMKRRKELHEMIAQYIENGHLQHLEEYYEILAHHYSNSNNIESSLSYLVKAGDKNRKIVTGSSQSALQYFSKASNILEQLQNKEKDFIAYKRDVYEGMGLSYELLGRFHEAISSYEALLDVSNRMKDHPTKAVALRKIANNKTQIGEWEKALDSYKESLDIVQNLGDLIQVGHVYNSIGYGYFERSDIETAMDYFQKALDIGHETGDPRLIGDSSNNLGMIVSWRNDFDQAIEYYQTALKYYKEVLKSNRDVQDEAQVYLNLGITHFKKNEVDVADRYYAECLRISEKCGYIRLMAYAYLNRTEVYLHKFDLVRAWDFCNKAFDLLRSLNDKWSQAEGYKYRGMIYRRQRDFSAAEEALNTSLELSFECDYLRNIAEVYSELGLLYRDQKIPRKAIEYFRESKNIYKELELDNEVARIERLVRQIKTELV
ncbi:tetratricopeptide repeat protein [Candidatus Poribacteria bacterium]|nr:tetratricopeptide repeat protein [Candidatus Poribacteria bacterium]